MTIDNLLIIRQNNTEKIIDYLQDKTLRYIILTKQYLSNVQQQTEKIFKISNLVKRKMPGKSRRFKSRQKKLVLM